MDKIIPVEIWIIMKHPNMDPIFHRYVILFGVGRLIMFFFRGFTIINISVFLFFIFSWMILL